MLLFSASVFQWQIFCCVATYLFNPLREFFIATEARNSLNKNMLLFSASVFQWQIFCCVATYLFNPLREFFIATEARNSLNKTFLPFSASVFQWQTLCCVAATSYRLILYTSLPANKKHPNPKSSKSGSLS